MAEDSVADATEDTSIAQPDPVRRATLIVTGVILVLICWYLAADRLTPFTSQARIKAYVVPIAPQVSGRVLEVKVGNNELVQAEQELVVIDPNSYQLSVQAAEASLAAARQQLGAATAAVEAARAGVGAAQARLTKADQEATRMRRIFTQDSGAISERRVQSAEASLVEARSSLAQAQANLEQARQNQGLAGEDNSRILSAQAALATARLDLERTVIRAPERGLVTDLAVDRGNYAQTGQPLMTFIAIQELWIQADMTENNLGHVTTGDAVEFVLDVQPGRVFSGEVRSVGFGVSSDNDSLGTLPTISNDPNWLRDAQRFPVVIDFDPGALKEPLGLRVGSQVSVIVYTDERWFMNVLGAIYIRLISLFSYAY